MSGGKYKDYCSPVIGYYKISSEFGFRGNPSGKSPRRATWHDGIDLGACKDRTVHAIEDGVVVRVDLPKPIPEGSRTKASRNGYTQGLVKIRHTNGTISTSSYVHLKENSIVVKRNQKVVKGQAIGIVGNTGHSYGAHLHFVLKDKANKPIDPMLFMEDCSTVISSFQVLKSEHLPDNRGVLRPVNVRRVTFKGMGIFKDAKNPGGIEKEPNPLKDSVPASFNVPDDVKKATTKNKDGQILEENQTDKEDMRNSLLSFYLPTIVDSLYAREQCIYGNIVEIHGGENTPLLSNIIFSKNLIKDKNKDYNDISTLELSNLSPFAELYSVKKDENGYSNILYPFDDFTLRQKIDTIFYDKTTRGGNVGLESVEFKTIATNPANKAQVSVRVRLLMQDIGQLENIRNGITLLDFLYPAASRDDEYDSRNFSVKIVLGWRYKEDNILMDDLNGKINTSVLSQVLYCSLHNHSFDFKENGAVELTMEYIGMIEAELADPYRNNILDELSNGGTTLSRTVKSWRKLLEDLENYKQDFATLGSSHLARLDLFQSKNVYKNTVTYTAKETEHISFEYSRQVDVEKTVNVSDYDIQRGYFVTYSGEGSTVVTENIMIDPAKVTREKVGVRLYYDLGDGSKILSLNEEGIENFKKEIKEKISELNKKVAKLYSQGFTALFKELSLYNKVKVLSVSKDNIDNIIQINKDRTLDPIGVKGIEKSAEKLSSTLGSGRITQIAPKEIDEANNKMEFKESFGEDTVIIDSDVYLSKILDNTVMEEGSVQIPFILLKDLLSYYHAKFYGMIPLTQQRELALFLGSFSYNTIDSFSTQSVRGEFAQSHTTLKTEIDENGDTFIRYPAKLKTTNIGNIPISIKSLVDWFNNNILNNNLKTMSYHTFIRKMMTELVNGSVNSNLTEFLNRRNVSVSMKYITTVNNFDELKPSVSLLDFEMEDGERVDHGFDEYIQQAESYVMDLSSDKYKKSHYYRLLEKPTTGPEAVDCLFILSSNEIRPSMAGNYKEDQEINVPHLYINQEKGLIKNIKFKKEDFAQLDSANIVKANKGNEGQAIIRKIYQAEVEMFGNSIFEPGQLVFINPSYPGSRLRNPVLHKIGLGGYYQVISVNSVLDQNKYSTSLDAKWVMSGVGDMKDKFTYTNLRVYRGKGEEIEETD